MLNVAGV